MLHVSLLGKIQDWKEYFLELSCRVVFLHILTSDIFQNFMALYFTTFLVHLLTKCLPYTGLDRYFVSKALKIVILQFKEPMISV